MEVAERNASTGVTSIRGAGYFDPVFDGSTVADVPTGVTAVRLNREPVAPLRSGNAGAYSRLLIHLIDCFDL
jgi:hypothetical protein